MIVLLLQTLKVQISQMKKIVYNNIFSNTLSLYMQDARVVDKAHHQ